MSAEKWRLTSDFVFLQVHANLLKTSTEHSQAVFEEVDAPLAQSVERFHGKEKVNSSILLGGSVAFILVRDVEQCGGVAQW